MRKCSLLHRRVDSVIDKLQGPTCVISDSQEMKDGYIWHGRAFGAFYR